MALDQESKKREAEAKQRLVAEAKKSIEAIINKIPADHSRWSYQRTVAFKSAVDKARQILKSERATVNSSADGCIRTSWVSQMNFADLMNAILRAEGKSDFGAVECLKEALCDHFKDIGQPQIAEHLASLLNRISDSIEDF